MNHNQNDGLLKMIKRTDPMINCLLARKNIVLFALVEQKMI